MLFTYDSVLSAKSLVNRLIDYNFLLSARIMTFTSWPTFTQIHSLGGWTGLGWQVVDSTAAFSVGETDTSQLACLCRAQRKRRSSDTFRHSCCLTRTSNGSGVPCEFSKGDIASKRCNCCLWIGKFKYIENKATDMGVKWYELSEGSQRETTKSTTHRRQQSLILAQHFSNVYIIKTF